MTAEVIVGPLNGSHAGQIQIALKKLVKPNQTRTKAHRRCVQTCSLDLINRLSAKNNNIKNSP